MFIYICNACLRCSTCGGQPGMRGSMRILVGGTRSISWWSLWWWWWWFKGILHQNIFYRLNLIFWIVMGYGIAHFGQRSLKTTETWKFCSQNLSSGVLRRGAPGVSRHSAMGFGGPAPWGFEGRRTDKTLQWFIILHCPSRSHGVAPLGPRCGTPRYLKILKLTWFSGHSDQNELYHTPLLSKIWD